VKTHKRNILYVFINVYDIHTHLSLTNYEGEGGEGWPFGMQRMMEKRQNRMKHASKKPRR
jgi:hypothetical protein